VAAQGTTLLFYLILFIHFYSNGVSGAAPQDGVAAPDGAPDFLLNLF
jgi:hypothetical protein